MTASARAGTPWEQLNFTEPFVSSSEMAADRIAGRRIKAARNALSGEHPRGRWRNFLP